MGEIWDLIESVSEGFPTYHPLYNKRNGFDFDIVIFPFLYLLRCLHVATYSICWSV